MQQNAAMMAVVVIVVLAIALAALWSASGRGPAGAKPQARRRPPDRGLRGLERTGPRDPGRRR